MIESLLPYRLMQPVIARREASQQQQWATDDHRLKMALRGPSWEDVRARAAGYDNARIDVLRVARWKGRPVGRSLAHGSILSLLMPTDGGTTSITDFGGGTGDVGEELTAIYPNLRYTVVETAGLVNLMRSQSRSSPVEFSESVPARCEIFYISGTLHYLPDPLEALERGLRSATKYAMIRRTRFSEIPIFDVQISRLFDNGLGPIPQGFADCEMRSPRRTLVERDVLDAATKCGFSLCYRAAEATTESDVYLADMVFRRK